MANLNKKKQDSPVDSKGSFQENYIKKQPKMHRVASLFLSFCILFSFWLLFSGKFDRFHIGLGIISCAGVSLVCRRLIFPNGVSSNIVALWVKFASYIPWLFKEIFWANLHVLYLTFHPNMMKLINPKIITFKSRLKSDVARTTFANSITLTPGTITIYSGIMGTFAVHCIDDRSGKDLPGEMEKQIGAVFDENG